MTSDRKKTPDFFSEDRVDPVESATGASQRFSTDKNAPSHEKETKSGPASGPAAKKKAGFYLSVQVLDRFNLKFHELKLAGFAIDNKSTLLELALSFALDDLDRGGESRVLQSLSG
jgi:hypothetical protein